MGTHEEQSEQALGTMIAYRMDKIMNKTFNNLWQSAVKGLT